MKNLRPYPAYKPTGLAWLPEVPREWDCRKFKYLFSERSEKGFPNEPLLAATQNHGVILKTEYENRTVTAEKGLETLKLVKVGDFVISLRSFEGGIELSYRQGIISPAYTIIFSNGELTNGYFKWLGKSAVFIQLLKTCVTGIREGQNIDYGRLRVSGVPIPLPAEQEAIVAYLDEKTAKIDRLIELKEREIKLLNEKKQAVISKVVTRGLDPNAELVDSGVDWIGKVPRGWKVVSLKRVCRLQGGSGFPVEMQGRYEDAIPFIKVNSLASNVSADRKYDTITIAEAKSLSATIFKKGSIVFAKVGAALLLHRFARLPFDCCIDNNMMGTVEINSDPEWLRYTMSLLNFNYFVNPGAVPSVNQSQVSSMKIPLPSLPEQWEIVAYLDAEGAKTDKAIAAVTRQIGLLKEYRTRLISDAVTGRIDLRKAVA